LSLAPDFAKNVQQESVLRGHQARKYKEEELIAKFIAILKA
jgi:hypothetical protein